MVQTILVDASNRQWNWNYLLDFEIFLYDPYFRFLVVNLKVFFVCNWRHGLSVIKEMLQAVLANLLSLRELHSGEKTRKTPRREITTSENNSKLFLKRISKEERILDRIMWGGRFSGDPLCFILWSVFSNQRVTLCATIITQRISIRFCLH